MLPDLLMVYRVDVLLFPIGLLAALAAADAPAAALLVLPLAYLLLSFSREREASMRKSLELGRAYRGTALLLRDLLEEDDEYTGRHTEDVVGLTVSVAERMGLDEDLAAPPSSARCCTTSARSPCPTRSSTSPARSTTRSGRS